VREVPQVEQNVRVTGTVDWYSEGEPRTKENRLVGNVSHATTGEPAARQQLSQ